MKRTVSSLEIVIDAGEDNVTFDNEDYKSIGFDLENNAAVIETTSNDGVVEITVFPFNSFDHLTAIN